MVKGCVGLCFALNPGNGEAKGVCKCCGGINQEDGSCKGPIISEKQCKYFGLNWDKPKGQRFQCMANGKRDGNCNGKLAYVNGGG